MHNQPIYNSNDLLVRKAVAASGIVKLAVQLSKQARRGSLDHCLQKKLEMIISQFQCIECYGALAVKAFGIFKPGGNSGADETSTLTVNSVVISDSFTIDNDNAATATRAALAINNLTSTPNYTAVVVGSEVVITADDAGTTPNGYTITYTSVTGAVSESYIGFANGQEGLATGVNCLTEDQMHTIFNNKADVTECGYEPAGYKYS